MVKTRQLVSGGQRAGAARGRVARQRRGGAIGLALGGGGARGLAHIGVLRVLEESGLPIEVVAGTSMGGLIGIAWAAGVPAAEMERLARSVRVLSLLGRDRTGLALASTDKVAAFVTKVVGKRNLEDLPRRCAVVALDIVSGRRLVIDRGPVERALQATIAIPGLLSPVCEGNVVLIDGGVIDPVPVGVAASLGARQIIAVDVCPAPDRPLVAQARSDLLPAPVASSLALLRLVGRGRIFDLLVKSFEVQSAEIARLQLRKSRPAVWIKPEVGRWRTDQFGDAAAACIAAGEAATRAHTAALRRLVPGARRHALET